MLTTELTLSQVSERSVETTDIVSHAPQLLLGTEARFTLVTHFPSSMKVFLTGILAEYGRVEPSADKAIL